MTTSPKTPLLSEIEGDAPLSEGALGYLCARNRDAFFSLIHDKLAVAEASGLKRSDIAARIRKSPTRLSHILGAPGNWTLDTVAELLAGICREEVIPSSLPIARHVSNNAEANQIMAHNCAPRAQYTIETSVNTPDASYNFNYKITLAPSYAPV